MMDQEDRFALYALVPTIGTAVSGFFLALGLGFFFDSLGLAFAGIGVTAAVATAIAVYGGSRILE